MWQEDYDREEPRYRRRFNREMEEDEGWFDEDRPSRWRGAGDREWSSREWGEEGRRGRWGSGSRYQSPYQSRGFEREREREGGYGRPGGFGRERWESREGFRDREGQGFRGRESYEDEGFRGRESYGSPGYGSQSYGSQRSGSQGYGSPGFGSPGYGSQGYGYQGQGAARGSQFFRGRESYGESYQGRGGYGGEGYLESGMESSYGRTRSRDFTGKGPKGWKRSDERIKEDVSEQFARHPDLDPSQVEIRVTDGEITLTGNVNDRDSKRLAEDIAENVQGVKDVTNQIRVTVSTSSQTTGSSGYGTSGTGSGGTSDTETSRSRSTSRTGTTT